MLGDANLVGYGCICISDVLLNGNRKLPLKVYRAVLVLISHPLSSHFGPLILQFAVSLLNNAILLKGRPGH
jgi:hypothetical protein